MADSEEDEIPVWSWRALGALVAALLLWAVVDTAQSLLPELDGRDFELRSAAVELAASQYAGSLAPRPGVVDLATYQAFTPKGAVQEGTLEIRATVPEGAQLLVHLGADLSQAGPTAPQGPGDGQRGPAGPPKGSAQGGPGGAGDPEGSGLPGQERGAVRLRVDRSSRMAVGVEGLRCTGEGVPSKDVALKAVFSPSTLQVFGGGTLWLDCVGTVPSGRVVIGSGVQRIHLHGLTLSTPEGTRSWTFSAGPWRWLAGLVGAGLGAWLLSTRGRVLWGVPILAYPLLAVWDGGPWLESLRLLSTPEAIAPWLLLAPWMLLGVGWQLARAPWPVALGLGAAPALVLGLVGLSQGQGLGWGLMGLGLLPLVGVIWVNRHPVQRRPIWSYLGLGLCLVLAEAGAQLSPSADGWVRTTGWDRAAQEFAELMEIQRYRSYPSEGFPVRPPEPSGRARVVAIGSSSTGGAYQMDNLQLFWPARLEERLPSNWEVVNQGVGGWNTLHMALYAEGQMARLRPDVVALYVGHNDVLTQASVPHSQLYAQYRPPSAGVAAVSAFLHKARLFNGFKFLLLSGLGGGDAVAVPVSDARQNLQRIIAASKAEGAKVLLLTEGLNPDPAPMVAYDALLQELAQDPDVRHLNAAGKLYETQDPTLFLDDCHLSMDGHGQLAAWVDAELRAAGWVP